MAAAVPQLGCIVVPAATAAALATAVNAALALLEDDNIGPNGTTTPVTIVSMSTCSTITAADVVILNCTILYTFVAVSA